MFCTNCGCKLVDGAKFCSECGTRVAVPVEQKFRTIADFEEPKITTPAIEEQAGPLEEVEAPRKKESLEFDWSNVVDEPQRKVIRPIKSPWDTTSSIDEDELYAEMTPSTDRSRTMSFIDLLKAEKEEKEKNAAEKAIEYTEVFNFEEDLSAFDEPPKLHFPPLYEDLDEPVTTPFDNSFDESFDKSEDTSFIEREAEKVKENIRGELKEAPKKEEKSSFFFDDEPRFEKPKQPDVEVSRETLAQFDEYVKSFEKEAGIAVEDLKIEEPEEAEKPERLYGAMPKFELPEFLKKAAGFGFEESPFAKPETKEEAVEDAVIEPAADDFDADEPEYETFAFKESDYEEPEAEASAFEVPAFETPSFDEPEPEEEPVFEAPVFDYQEPVKEEPEYEAPIFNEPEEEPVKEEYEALVFNEPEAEEEPVLEAPTFDYQKPVKEEPVKEEPKKEEPVYEASSFDEPEPEEEPVVEEEPKKEEPKKEEPKKGERVFGIPLFRKLGREKQTYKAPAVVIPEEEPVEEEPIKEEPAYEAPVFEEPVKEEPAYEAPIFSEPEEPVYETAAYEKPYYDEPVFEEPEVEPVYDEPVFEAPEEPVFEEPVFEEPVYEEPVSVYDEPVFEEPVFEEPKYEEEEISSTYSFDEDDEYTYQDASSEYEIEEPVQVQEVTREETMEESPESIYLDMDMNTVETFRPEVFTADEEPEPEIPAKHAEPEDIVPAEEAEDTFGSIDELELFEEMEASKPSKTGMTIAAPADRDSEIEDLKRRLAELMGGSAPEEDEYADVAISLEEASKADFTFAEVKTPHVADLFDGLMGEIEEDDDEITEQIYQLGRRFKAEDFDDFEEPEEPEAPDFKFDPIVNPAVDELFEGFKTEEEYIEQPVETTVIEASVEEPVAEAPAVQEIPAAEPMTAAQVSAVEDLYMEEPVAEIPAVQEAPEPVVPEITFAPEPVVPTAVEAPAVEEVYAPAASIEDDENSDALSLEDLERNLFGDVLDEETEAEETKKIDKFYTLYRKNEEFQRLLDEEYDKLRGESAQPAAEKKPEEIPVEQKKVYRAVEDETIYMPKELVQQMAKEEAASKSASKAPASVTPVEAAPAKAAPAEAAPSGLVDIGTLAKPAENVFSANITADQSKPLVEDVPQDKAAAKEDKKADRKAAKAAAKAEKAKKKEEKKLAKSGATEEIADADDFEYEDVDSGSGFLTVLAVIIAIILVILLAVILILQVAPDSGAAAWIDSLIENITGGFSVIETHGGQFLL